MGGSFASAGARTAALGIVGVAALAAGVLTGHGTHDGLLLAAAGGFSLGVAVALVLTDTRTGERAVAMRPAGRAPAPPSEGRTNGHHTTAQGPGAAAVARATVAAVAHDMSNPLASLRSNLEWLRDALEAGRLDAPEEQAEAHEVLRDAREAAERLRMDVGQLRAAGRGEPPSPPV